MAAITTRLRKQLVLRIELRERGALAGGQRIAQDAKARLIELCVDSVPVERRDAIRNGGLRANKSRFDGCHAASLASGAFRHLPNCALEFARLAVPMTIHRRL